MKGRITLLLLVSIALLCGCALLEPPKQLSPLSGVTPPSAVVTNEEEILGIWKQVLPQGFDDLRVGFIQFKEDGTYRVATGVVTNLEDTPQVQGRYEVGSGVMVLVPSDESALCSGKTGTYDVQWTAEGYLEFSPREDPCSWQATYLLLNEVYEHIRP